MEVDPIQVVQVVVLGALACVLLFSQKKAKKIHQKKKCPFLSGDDKWEHVLKKSNITTIL